jgi:hypothetical protein
LTLAGWSWVTTQFSGRKPSGARCGQARRTLGGRLARRQGRPQRQSCVLEQRVKQGSPSIWLMCEMVDALPPALENARRKGDARGQWNELLRLAHPEYDLGTSPEFRMLGCLFRLRDHIAHRSARVAAPDTFPGKLLDCVRQGTIPARKASPTDWTSVLLVHEVARWAATTASAWLNLSRKLLPRMDYWRTGVYKMAGRRTAKEAE